MLDASTLLAALALGLALLGLAAFATGELLVAGVLLLGTSLTIFLRETRT